MIVATLRDFAQALGIPVQHADDALRSARAARAVLTRRSLFAAAGAMASGAAFSFPRTRQPVGELYVNGVKRETVYDLNDLCVLDHWPDGQAICMSYSALSVGLPAPVASFRVPLSGNTITLKLYPGRQQRGG